MTQEELIISAALSIITGMISGILVTLYYRWKDKKVELQVFLDECVDYLIMISKALKEYKVNCSYERLNEVLLFKRQPWPPSKIKKLKEPIRGMVEKSRERTTELIDLVNEKQSIHDDYRREVQGLAGAIRDYQRKKENQ